jgi:hypothetical protein
MQGLGATILGGMMNNNKIRSANIKIHSTYPGCVLSGKIVCRFLPDGIAVFFCLPFIRFIGSTVWIVTAAKKEDGQENIFLFSIGKNKAESIKLKA